MRQQHTPAHQPASRTLLANRVCLCVREEKRMCSLLATPSLGSAPTQRLLEKGTRTPLDARRGKRWGSDAQARPHRMRCSPTNMHTLCTLLFTTTRMRKTAKKKVMKSCRETIVPPGGPFKTTLFSQSTLRLAPVAAVTTTAMLPITATTSNSCLVKIAIVQMTTPETVLWSTEPI